MNVNVIHHAYLNKVQKIISAGSVSSYPLNTKIPFKEKDIWNGFPEEINSSYGITKRMIHAQSLSYKKQYGFKSILLLFTNLYGPNDNFDPKSSHVIAALIKKFSFGKIKNSKFVEVWGNGSATRDFCYIDDAVNGLILAAKKYSGTDPLNIGSGKEISIRQLAILIKNIIRYNGKIKWLKSKPTGPARRRLDISKAKKKIGFNPTISLKKGLKDTISWYYKNHL
jgi:GDP-L-fucose synthase